MRLARHRDLWPTPTAQDSKNDAGPAQLERKASALNVVAATFPEGAGPHPPGLPSGGGGSRSTPLLNPEFVERLMGLPETWTRIDDDG